MSGKGKKNRGGNRSKNVAALEAAAFAPATVSIEDAIDEVEQLIEQSDLYAAEEVLRSAALLGTLKPAEIQAQHAHLVPAMELLAQVLIGMQKSKQAFEIRLHTCRHTRTRV